MITYTIIFLIICAPLFFKITRSVYEKDVNDHIKFNYANFKNNYLKRMKISDIGNWNLYNTDIKILPFEKIIGKGKITQESYRIKGVGHNVDFRILYVPIKIEGRDYLFVSKLPMIEDHDIIKTLTYLYITIIAILVTIVILGNKMASRKLWEPFYDSLEKMERFNIEKEVVPEFGKTRITEFTRLNENIKKLIQKDINAYKQQKEFIENASHELQTPLAVFKSQLDILLQDKKLSEHEISVIRSLYSVSSRMTRLNKNLLLLAKIDNNQFSEMERIVFSDILNDHLSLFKEIAENEGLKMKINIRDKIEVKANKTLLECMIDNLISNAIKHNIPGGFIRIELEKKSFSVTNSGEPEELDKTQICKRFNKTSSKNHGNGLGLSIVSGICKTHNWKLEYQFSPFDTTHAFRILM